MKKCTSRRREQAKSSPTDSQHDSFWPKGRFYEGDVSLGRGMRKLLICLPMGMRSKKEGPKLAKETSALKVLLHSVPTYTCREMNHHERH